MELNISSEAPQTLEQLNLISEETIRASYLAGRCRSVWIVGQDDGMDLD